MRIQLYIENYEIELTEDVQFLLNKQFEEIDNPTIIINDWSKTVSIPFTEHNNKIFGYIYKPERIIIGNESDPDVYKEMGIYFDPTKKLDFKLIYNTTVLMTGYAKMNEIKQNKGKGTYDITLFGQLGKIFQELSKITFNVNDENSNYIIDGTQYIDASINKALVYSSWTSSGQTHSSIDNATITDIIGFAPNNSYYENFDPKTYQYDTAASTLFTETLKHKWDDGNEGYVTGIDPESAIPNGMLPRDIGEFRSYYQTPFIYWNKLWQIFQKKAETITGYTWDLDNDWFNTSNPYYYKLVYMLKPFNVKNGTSLDNHYTKWGKDAVSRNLGRSTTPGQPQLVRKLAMPIGASVVTNNKIETYPLLTTYDEPQYSASYPHIPTNVAVFKCPDEFSSIIYKWNIPMYIETKVSGSHLRDNSGLIISMKLWGCDDLMTQANSRLIQTNNYIIRHEDSGFTYRDYTPIDTGSSPSSGDNRYKLVFNISSNFHASAAKCGPYCYFTLECSYTDDDPMTNGLGDQGYTWYRDSTSVDVTLSSGAFRSGTHFTLNDLWDNSYNLFDQILNYCKMYRILIFADDINKTLKFIRAPKYFSSYSIVDWSDKLDLTKDFIVKPLTFDNKYVIFNYDDNTTKLGKKYKESWGVNYGEKKLITDYNFNEDKKSLFDKKITTSITNTDFSLSWTNLYDYDRISYSLPAEIFPYAKDDNNKYVNIFGAYYFFVGKKYFDTTTALHMRGVKVSDDTTFQLSNDTYYYSQNQSYTDVTSYPGLDIVYSDEEKLCLFNMPNENYTYSKNFGNTKGIYDMFWKRYIDERYDIQNKKITCYIKLSLNDFTNFEYNHFVKIDNILYIVNKIYDYNIATSEPTKVDLISISNINAYYVDYYSDYLTVSPTSITMDGSTGTENITISAYQNAWNYVLLDGQGEPVPSTQEITITKINDTTLQVTKNGDYNLNYQIQIYTPTHFANVAVTGARNLYFDVLPTTIIARKNHSDEFDMVIQTNYANAEMVADNTVQWWRASTGTWYTTVFSAASYVEGFGSPTPEDRYNNAHEDREVTVHIKVVNPTQDRQISFIGGIFYDIHKYVDIKVVDSIYTTTSNGEYIDEDSVNYHGTSSTRGYKVVSDSAWSLSLPSGVRSYGPTSGDAGTTSVTFDWGSGNVGETKTIVFTNASATCSIVCTYVNN